MKYKKGLMWLLTILPLLLSSLTYPSLPDKIPAHFGKNMVVDRWGNRIEVFVFPLVIVVLGLFFYLTTRYMASKEVEGHNNERISVTISLLVLGIFNLLNGFMLYSYTHQLTHLQQLPLPIERVIVMCIGVLMVVMGNILPKTRLVKGPFRMGFRTPWADKNEAVWKQNQKVAGISSIVVGCLFILLALLTHGALTCILASSLIGFMVVSLLIYSYQIAKKVQ